MTDPYSPLAQQEQILRDIRDEIKGQRNDNVSASMGSTPSGRPNPGFVKTQQTMDRMVAGEWGSLGWASAYQTQIKSSLANDMLGAMGLRAAPQTMWQREYESMSGSMMLDRIASFPAGLVMPGFVGRSRQLGQDLYSASGRFNRAGDGRDTSFSSVHSMARDIQLQASLDPRLSGRDYNTIFSDSAAAGQFDYATGLGGQGGVKGIFEELKSAVGDLTKTMRMSVSEVSQTLGAFRQFGIVDIADQRRMGERMSASARVAGLSTPEMATLVRGGIESGMQYGLGAQGSAALTQNLAMAAREASRSGLVSGHVVASGGGVQGIVSAQQNAINQFAGSNTGFYSLIGGQAGGDGSLLGDLNAGIGMVGGSTNTFVGAEARRMDIMGALSGSQRTRLYNKYLDQQMKMLGVDPTNSAEATDYAFQLSRGSMGDAAALAYARSNYSTQGRRQRFRESFGTEMELERQKSQQDYQRYTENESFIGKFRQGTGLIGYAVGSAGTWAGNKLGQLGRAMGMDGTFTESLKRMEAEGGDADLSPESLAAAASVGLTEGADNNAASRVANIKLMGSVRGRGWRGWAATTGGALAGAGTVGGLTALALTPTGPIGMAIGGTLGAVAGGIGGSLLASGLVGSWGSNAATELTGQAAQDYMSAFAASTGKVSQRANNISGNKEAGTLSRLMGSSSYKSLISKMDRTNLAPDESSEVARLAASAAHEAGGSLTTQDVLGVARNQGMEVDMQAFYGAGIGSSKGYVKSMDDLLDGAKSKGLMLASANVAEGIRAYAQAGKDTTQQGLAMNKLREAGITGAAMQQVRDKVGGMKDEDRAKLADDAKAYIQDRGSKQGDKLMAVMGRVATSKLSEMGISSQEDKARLEELAGKRGPGDLLDLLTGNAEGKDKLLAEALGKSDPFMAKVMGLGSMTDLMETSSDNRLKEITGASDETLSRMRDAARKFGGNNATGAFRKAVGMMAFGANDEVKQASSPEGVAASTMKTAADILDRIVKDLNQQQSGGKK